MTALLRAPFAVSAALLVAGLVGFIGLAVIAARTPGAESPSP